MINKWMQIEDGGRTYTYMNDKRKINNWFVNLWVIVMQVILAEFTKQIRWLDPNVDISMVIWEEEVGMCCHGNLYF